MLNNNLIDKSIIYCDSITPKNTTKSHDLKSFINNIKNAIDYSSYSHKFIGQDNITNDFFSENDMTGSYLNGSEYKYPFPRGFIQYNKKHQFMMECCNIQYMISNKIIPYKLITINKIFNIKRTIGSIQTSTISNNNCMKLSKNKNNNSFDIKMFVLFYTNGKEQDINNLGGDSEKCITLNDIFSINTDIKNITITFKYIDKSQIDLMENLSQTQKVIYYNGIHHYNNKLTEYIEFIKEVININKYPITIKIINN
jgi:hypothetical protein